jgi:hypothetical protein
MNFPPINVPKPEFGGHPFSMDMSTLYYHQILTTAVGAQIMSVLESDHRVRALKNTMLSLGNTAMGFSINALAAWFVWAVREFGQTEATAHLETYLDAEEIPVVNTLWVIGINTEKTIELNDGYRIVPLKEMPDSRDKEQYQKFEFRPHMPPTPNAAICQTSMVRKATAVDDEVGLAFNHEIGKIVQHLDEIALLINAVEDFACLPYFSTTYSLPTMPFGPFGGSGGGYAHYDILGHTSSKISGAIIPDLEKLRIAFGEKGSMEQLRLRRILFRLSQARRRDQIEDKILDLGIALEMALLDDNKIADQLSLTFRLRGSWLAGKNADERKQLYKQLRELYILRSQVAHTGSLCGNNHDRINTVRESFPEYSQLAGRIVRGLLLEGRPDWTELILNA